MKKLFPFLCLFFVFTIGTYAWPYSDDQVDVVSGAAPVVNNGREMVLIEYKESHASRHFLGTIHDWPTVKDAITKVVLREAMNSEFWGPFSGRIMMQGETVEYRGFGFGTVNRIAIGTVFPVTERDLPDR